MLKNILRIKVLLKYVELNIKRINLFNMIMINVFFFKIVSECVWYMNWYLVVCLYIGIFSLGKFYFIEVDLILVDCICLLRIIIIMINSID